MTILDYEGQQALTLCFWIAFVVVLGEVYVLRAKEFIASAVEEVACSNGAAWDLA